MVTKNWIVTFYCFNVPVLVIFKILKFRDTLVCKLFILIENTFFTKSLGLGLLENSLQLKLSMAYKEEKDGKKIESRQFYKFVNVSPPTRRD